MQIKNFVTQKYVFVAYSWNYTKLSLIMPQKNQFILKYKTQKGKFSNYSFKSRN